MYTMWIVSHKLTQVSHEVLTEVSLDRLWSSLRVITRSTALHYLRPNIDNGIISRTSKFVVDIKLFSDVASSTKITRGSLSDGEWV